MKLFVITGACGAGKSTIKDALAQRLDPAAFACIDCDEVGYNWWDYAGTDHESQYKDDCLAEAVRRAGDRDLVFATCLSPQDYIAVHAVPDAVESTCFVVLCPSDEEIRKRLRARPKERGFTSDEIIQPHVEFNQWFRRNRGKFPLMIDNTDQLVEETAARIAAFITGVRACG